MVGGRDQALRNEQSRGNGDRATERIRGAATAMSRAGIAQRFGVCVAVMCMFSAYARAGGEEEGVAEVRVGNLKPTGKIPADADQADDAH